MKNDLISRSALLEKAIEEKRFVFRMEDLLREEEVFQTVYKDLASFILSAPAVDAVELVRCKDCEAWQTETAMSFLRDGVHVRCCVCGVYGRLMYEDDFCSKGKRR